MHIRPSGYSPPPGHQASQRHTSILDRLFVMTLTE